MLKEYRTLWPYVKRKVWPYIVGLFFLVVTDGGQMILPQYIRRGIDTIASGEFVLAEIARLMITMVVIAVAIALGRFGWRYFISGSSRRIEAELREDLYNHLLKLSSSFYKDMKTGDIMARLTNDMEAIRMASGIALVAFVDGLFMSLAILIILFTNYPALTFFTIIPLPLVFAFVFGAGRLLHIRFRRVQEGFSTLSEEVRESISGLGVIKSFVKERHFLSRFEVSNDEYLKANIELIKVWGLLFPVITFLSGATSLALLYFGGDRVLLGTFSPGDFVAFMSYLAMLIWPMIGAGFMINVLQRGAVSMGRINQILETEPDIVSEPGAFPLGDGGIEVRDLTFSFDDNRRDLPEGTVAPATPPVLENVSFTIERGSTLGILGPTGSGKTTLLRLIQRLIDPPRGSILYDNRDIREYHLDSLRSSFAVVPQESLLFSTTIKDNIAFGVPDADEGYLGAMAEHSTISRDLAQFPDGWNSTVGEKGLTLSGGQKQRVAISRALAVDPKLLILDDSLSAVDTETEEKILGSIRDLRRDKTTIIVSHRISTLEVADKVIVLDGGKIVQMGTPDALRKEDGIFRRIYELQLISQGSGGSDGE